MERILRLENFPKQPLNSCQCSQYVLAYLTRTSPEYWLERLGPNGVNIWAVPYFLLEWGYRLKKVRQVDGNGLFVGSVVRGGIYHWVVWDRGVAYDPWPERKVWEFRKAWRVE